MNLKLPSGLYVRIGAKNVLLEDMTSEQFVDFQKGRDLDEAWRWLDALRQIYRANMESALAIDSKGKPRQPDQPEVLWNGISRKDRTLWFGVAEEGMEAPWFSPFGACLVKIWDIRRRADGVVEFGIGNETKPEPSEIGWVTGDKFFEEWPQ